MPLSNTFHLPVVVQFVSTLMPKTLLDAGIGMGVGGYLMRMHCDINAGRLKKAEWQTRIEGIEIFDAYRNPVWDYAYDKVHIGDIRSVLATLPNFELITCLDVLEHFPRDQARLVVRRFLEHAPVLIATTPNIRWPQGAVFGNEAETHHSDLDTSDFTHLVAQVKTGDTTCFVCCRDPKLTPILRRATLKMPVTKQRWWVKRAIKLRQLAIKRFQK